MRADLADAFDYAWDKRGSRKRKDTLSPRFPSMRRTNALPIPGCLTMACVDDLSLSYQQATRSSLW